MKNSRSVERPRVTATLLCLAWASIAWACDGGSPPLDAGAQSDAGAPLPASELFGPCQQDGQCPGEGAVCRRASEGWPGGYCTVPCEDRTPCDYRGVYHHCATRSGETQAYCERRCLNGIDCGREGYSCEGELPPSGGVCIAVCSSDAQCGAGTTCNRFSGQCVTTPPVGAVTGEGCARAEDCQSGRCVGELDAAGVPSGWVGGYCVGNCVLPPGYNTSEFFSGSELPSGSCAGDAVCLPNESYARGDLGTCYDQCRSADDCRAGYTCLQRIQLSQDRASFYENGLCVPADCARTPCPSGYECVTVSGANGPQNVCAPR